MSKVEGAVLLAAAPAPGEGRSAAGTDQGEAKPATFRCHGGTGLGDAAARPGHQGLETRQRARPDLKEREPAVKTTRAQRACPPSREGVGGVRPI
jgi:hypothetical protein